MSIIEKIKLNHKDLRYVLQGTTKFSYSAEWKDLKRLRTPVLNDENIKEYKDSKYKYFRVVIGDNVIIKCGSCGLAVEV